MNIKTIVGAILILALGFLFGVISAPEKIVEVPKETIKEIQVEKGDSNRELNWRKLRMIDDSIIYTLSEAMGYSADGLRASFDDDVKAMELATERLNQIAIKLEDLNTQRFQVLKELSL